MRWSRRLIAGASIIACLAVALVPSCDRHLDPPEQHGELVVAIRATPAYYQQDGTAAKGFEHDMVTLFGSELGVRTRFVLARDHAELLRLVREGEAHFAAAAPVSINDGLIYSAVLRESGQVLVQHADAPPVDDGALTGKKVEVLRGSPQEALLSGDAGFAAAEVVALEGINEIDLLERVSQGKSELAATDMTHLRLGMNFFPDVEEAMELDGNVSFAWAFPRNVDADLFEKAQAFIRRVRRDGTLNRIHDRYFGHIHRINSEGVADFLEQMSLLLPRYRREFIAAQQLSGIDWRLIAALAYQESHWDPLATSPTGVRGMMMLTEETADRLNVKNRLDARQSIRAGARYLADLIEQFPPTVKEPDRTWLALAAYNLGLGHMNGARAIAAGLKRDPDSWYDMKKVLPLLARQQYYKRLKSGRARGGEAVIMVENVRTFQDILTRFEAPYQTRNYAPPMFSIPPMYDRSDAGTVTPPLPF